MVCEIDLVMISQWNKIISCLSVMTTFKNRKFPVLRSVRFPLRCSQTILQAWVILLILCLHSPRSTVQARHSESIFLHELVLLLLIEPIVWLDFAAQAIDRIVAGFGEDYRSLNLSQLVPCLVFRPPINSSVARKALLVALVDHLWQFGCCQICLQRWKQALTVFETTWLWVFINQIR